MNGDQTLDEGASRSDDIDPRLLPEEIDGDAAGSVDAPDSLDASGMSQLDLAAAERFTHGLLEHLRRDDPARQRARIRRILRAIDAENAALSLAAWKQRLRWMAPLAGSLAALLAVAIILGIPVQRSAEAMVATSLTAARAAGDRSYIVQATLEDESVKIPPARLDIRDATHQVFAATAPNGEQFILGRDGDNAWSVHSDGSIDRFPNTRSWPKWIDFGPGIFLAEPIDSLLEGLPSAYTLSRTGSARTPDEVGVLCERITALLRADATSAFTGNPDSQRVEASGGAPRRGPGGGKSRRFDPVRVELWIDPSSRQLRRMELHWDKAPALISAQPSRDERGGPRPRGDRGGPPPKPPGEEFGSPPPKPPGDDHGTPPLLRKPRGFMASPHDGRRGEAPPPPPRLIVFELVDAAPFAPEWFQPESHVKRDRE